MSDIPCFAVLSQKFDFFAAINQIATGLNLSLKFENISKKEICEFFERIENGINLETENSKTMNTAICDEIVLTINSSHLTVYNGTIMDINLSKVDLTLYFQLYHQNRYGIPKSNILFIVYPWKLNHIQVIRRVFLPFQVIYGWKTMEEFLKGGVISNQREAIEIHPWTVHNPSMLFSLNLADKLDLYTKILTEKHNLRCILCIEGFVWLSSRSDIFSPARDLSFAFEEHDYYAAMERITSSFSCKVD